MLVFIVISQYCRRFRLCALFTFSPSYGVTFGGRVKGALFILFFLFCFWTKIRGKWLFEIHFFVSYARVTWRRKITFMGIFTIPITMIITRNFQLRTLVMTYHFFPQNMKSVVGNFIRNLFKLHLSHVSCSNNGDAFIVLISPERANNLYPMLIKFNKWSESMQ